MLNPIQQVIETPPCSSDLAITRSEILSALSFALDLTEDAVPGHALRTCLLGMRLAAALGLSEDERASLYYALLLKDVGCSSNAARMCQIIGGDDRATKTGARLEDWTRPHSISKDGLRMLWSNVLPEAGVFRRAGRMLTIALTQHRNNREMIALRCDRGARIIRKLGLSDTAALAVRSLDEHWDGSGYPDGLRGGEIPLLARILNLAQHLEIFATERSPEIAIYVSRERSGRWFDPELVRLAVSLHRERTLWTDCLASRVIPGSDASFAQTLQDEVTRQRVIELAPAAHDALASSAVDDVCTAFADVVDAKSPFTHQHSIRVTETATRLANQLGLPPDRIRLVHRAALLHDIGKLRVPNTILDKAGPLDPQQRKVVEEHPGLTRSILGRVTAFTELASIAGSHHERLDGSGYPERLRADDLPIEARILALADVYSALTEVRPYRTALSTSDALSLLQRDVPHQFDQLCFDALHGSQEQ